MFNHRTARLCSCADKRDGNSISSCFLPAKSLPSQVAKEREQQDDKKQASVTLDGSRRLFPVRKCRQIALEFCLGKVIDVNVLPLEAIYRLSELQISSTGLPRNIA